LLIRNPTKNQIEEWFKCKKKMAIYLTTKGKIPFIAMDGKGFYYFVKSENLKKEISKIPWWTKIFNFI
jgi:hypothetical protein